MEPNYVLAQVSDASDVDPSFFLNHIDGETQDEDGDWATDFIVADPMPSGIPSSSSSDARLADHYYDFPTEADPSFICQACFSYLPLEMLGPEIQCGCLCCILCMRRSIDMYLSQEIDYSREDVDSKSRHSYEDVLVALCCPCPSCYREASISSSVIQSVSPEAFRLIEDKANQSFFRSANYAFCPGCNVMVEKVPGDIPAGVEPSGVPEFDKTMPFIELDDNGKPLTRDALLHKCYNYYKCSICKAGFCGLCMKIPYHLGYTCNEYEEFQNSDKCIYCETCIPKKSLPEERVRSITNVLKLLSEESLDTSWCVEKKDFLSVLKLSFSVCSADDCRKQLQNACTRVLFCGHRCGGLKTERKCLPCMEDGCRENSFLRESPSLPSADDWCSICMVETLRAAPAVQLKCGHIVHFKCAKRKIHEGFPGPEITFGYLKCPQCSEYMEHESLTRDLEKPLQLLELVRERALKRAQIEKLNPSMGRIDLADHALKKYNFYLCSKCQNPYYGGNRECGARLEDDVARNQYDRLELVCGGCSAAMIDGTSCVKGHGKKYVEFKCRYCCTVATYFCFGRTHFCNSCHETRPDGNPNYVPPLCGGPNTCPLKVAHAPNGEESCLGCSMCRILSQ